MNKNAYTLAEVLITLGVIGVIASITLPSLIKSHQKQVTVSKLKKFYTVSNQAFIMAQQDNGEYAQWDKMADIGRQAWFEKYIKPYYKSVKTCSGYSTPCGYNSNFPWKYRSGAGVGLGVFSDSVISFITNDGVLVVWPEINWAGNAFIRVDINNNKKPNILGYDTFYFHLTPSKKFFEPYGKEKDEETITTSCVKDGSFCGAKIMLDGWTIKDDYKW